MAVKLHASAFDYAKELIRNGQVKVDKRDDWSEHRPTAEEENRFISAHGYNEYGKWFLGIDDERPAPDQWGDMNFPSATSRRSTCVACWRPKAGRDNTNMPTSSPQQQHLHGMIIAKAKEKGGLTSDRVRLPEESSAETSASGEPGKLFESVCDFQ